jgi:hypothetical protein
MTALSRCLFHQNNRAVPRGIRVETHNTSYRIPWGYISHRERSCHHLMDTGVRCSFCVCLTAKGRREPSKTCAMSLHGINPVSNLYFPRCMSEIFEVFERQLRTNTCFPIWRQPETPLRSTRSPSTPTEREDIVINSSASQPHQVPRQ